MSLRKWDKMDLYSEDNIKPMTGGYDRSDASSDTVFDTKTYDTGNNNSSLGNYSNMWQDSNPLKTSLDSYSTDFSSKKNSSTGIWNDIKNGFLSGLNTADKAIIDIPKTIYKPFSWLSEKLVSGYNPNQDVILQGLNKASDYYSNSAKEYDQNSGDSTTDKVIAGAAAFVPEALGTVLTLGMPIPKVGSLGKVLDNLGTPIEEGVTNLLGKSTIGQYVGKGAKNAAEFSSLNALDTAAQGGNWQDVGNSALHGAGQGVMFGLGGKALGDLGRFITRKNFSVPSNGENANSDTINTDNNIENYGTRDYTRSHKENNSRTRNNMDNITSSKNVHLDNEMIIKSPEANIGTTVDNITQSTNQAYPALDRINKRMQDIKNTATKLMDDNNGKVTREIQSKIESMGAEYNALQKLRDKRQRKTSDNQIDNNIDHYTSVNKSATTAQEDQRTDINQPSQSTTPIQENTTQNSSTEGTKDLTILTYKQQSKMQDLTRRDKKLGLNTPEFVINEEGLVHVTTRTKKGTTLKSTIDRNGTVGNSHFGGTENVKTIEMKTNNDVEPSTESKVSTIINTDFSKIEDIDTLNAHINNIREAMKSTKDSSQLLKMNLQLFAAQKQLKKVMMKSRFIENSIKVSSIAPEEMKNTIKQPEYEPITNKETWEKAQNKVNNDLQGSLNQFIEKNEVTSADDTALGEALINKAIQEGRISDANSFSINLAEKLVRAGQTVQAAAIFKRLTPEGMLQYANRTIQNANEKLPPNKKIKLLDHVAKKIVKDMQLISKMPDGKAKTEATQVILKHIANQIPSSLLKKIDTFQTMVQLLNPKTSIRNILGNAGMQVNENLSNVVGTPIDIATTGIRRLAGNKNAQRTVGLPSLSTQVKGYVEGSKTGTRKVKLGISDNNTQFELPNGQVFKNRFLNEGQKILDYMLKVPDEAAKSSIYNDSLRTQMKLANIDKPTKEMELIAENDAKYGTFQDDNAVSRAFSTIKRAMNGGKEFGLGSLLLKYPKTPANILMRAIDYSPAGFFKATYRLAEPLIKGTEFNQRDFVRFTSRALVGTGNLIGAGYMLNKLGIITGKSNTDMDTANMQKQIGLGDYKLNLSALARFVSSGFNPNTAKIQQGDKLINYDWLQPSSIGLAIGANAADKTKNGTDLLTTLVDAVDSGMNTLAQQPLISGLTTALGQKDASKILTTTLRGVPASFMPTIFKQIAQLIDNTTRSTYDPSWINQSVNMVKSKVPVLSTNLQPKLNSLGNEQKAYESNSLFNVFLNPAFNTTYNPSEAAQLPLDIYNETGDVTAMPRQTPTYIMYNGKKIVLTPEEATDFQRNVGQKIAQAIEALGNMPANDNTAKLVQNIMTGIQASERNAILKNRGISTDKTKPTTAEKEQSKRNLNTKKAILKGIGIKE